MDVSFHVTNYFGDKTCWISQIGCVTVTNGLNILVAYVFKVYCFMLHVHCGSAGNLDSFCLVGYQMINALSWSDLPWPCWHREIMYWFSKLFLAVTIVTATHISLVRANHVIIFNFRRGGETITYPMPARRKNSNIF